MEETRTIGKRLLSAALVVAMIVTTMATQVFAAPEDNGTVTETPPDQVLSWSWPEDSFLTWVEDTQAWTLACVYSEEQPLTEEVLPTLLPGQITAVVQSEAAATAETAEGEEPPSAEETTPAEETTGAGEEDIATEESATPDTAAPAGEDTAAEEVTAEETATAETSAPESAQTAPRSLALDLTWNLESLSFPLQPGNYTLTATLPQGYRLAEGTPALQITLQVTGATTLAAVDVGNVIEDTVSPVGTTINVFDYWTTTEYGDGTPYAVDAGINKDHILKFTQANRTGSQDYEVQLKEVNLYDSGIQPKQGIVQNKLVNGYPCLQENSEWNIYDGEEESLAYLFNNSSVEGSGSSYQEGKRVWNNVKGLLQIDNERYYYYDSKTNFAELNKETGTFSVYEKENSKGYPKTGGQFFPLDSAFDTNMTHYFGVTMTTRFIQLENGETEDGKPVTYEFSGDDDVWVFIDDVLVGDLGGIHGAVSLTIDFSTGDVTVKNPKGGEEETTTIKAKYEAAGALNSTKWRENSNTFADNTYHTLKFFYLERGSGESNMKLKFNLVSIPQSDLIKVDQQGNWIEGAEFELYYADDNYQEQKLLATGVTDDTGSFVFMREDGTLLGLNSLKEDYGGENGTGKFVLREKTTPPGYRTSGDMHLYFADTDQAILLSENEWDTGAYAMPMLTATLPDKPQASPDYAKGETIPSPDKATGTFFAVVMKKVGNTWYPVSGDPISGWSVHKTTDGTTLEQAILDAARETNYVFQLDSSGQYKATLENLPGSILQYYYMLLLKDGQAAAERNAQYTVAYYYTESASLKDATHVVLLDSNLEEGENGYLEREFSVRLYVPNIKNVLFVQKVDDNGNALTGAQFTLTQLDENENPIESTAQTVTTTNLTQEKDGINLSGAAVFPSAGNVLANGTYILTETKAPDGYAATTQETTIIVDSTGVYADAGAANDDVTVLRGAGNLVRSMVQFAEKDDVDMTLYDITATLYTAGSYSAKTDASTGFWDGWTSSGQSINLSYGSSSHVLDYGLAEGESGNLYFTVDEGWSSVKITQTPFSEDDPDASLKQKLKDGQDLSRLFSRSTVVRVKNDPIGLTIKKTVVNETGTGLTQADTQQEFTIQISLKSTNGSALQSEYHYRDAQGQAQTLTFDKGTAQITLQHGESINLYDLPEGIAYTVTEVTSPNDWYTPSYTVYAEDGSVLPGGNTDEATGTLQSSQKNQTVEIVNTRKTGSVAISKEVTGDLGDKTRKFTFTLQLQEDAAVLTGNFAVTGNGAAGSNLSFDTTGATVELTDGQTLTVSGLPVGAILTATETAVNGYTTQVNGKDGSSGIAVVSNTDIQQLAFVNDCAIRPPTGLNDDTGPYTAMVVLASVAALAGLAGWMAARRRKRREQE